MLGEGRQGDCGEEADSGICRAGIHAKADYTPIHMYPVIPLDFGKRPPLAPWHEVVRTLERWCLW